MSTNAYAKIAQNVLKLMKRKGQTMFLVRSSVGTYSSTTQKVTGSVETKEKVYGVEFPLPPSERLVEAVKGTQKAIYLEAISPTTDPSAYDALEIGTKRYQIVSSDPLSPAGLAVLHELRVSAGG